VNNAITPALKIAADHLVPGGDKATKIGHNVIAATAARR